MARVLVNIPAKARPGEIIEIKVLISHPMETGYRPGPNGRILARDIISRFTCQYNGTIVFSAELHPAIAANPYLVFTTRAEESGTILLTWSGDNGFRQTETRTIEVA